MSAMNFLKRFKSRKKSQVARRRLLIEPLEPRSLMAFDLAAIAGTAFVDATGNGFTPDDAKVSGATVQLYRDNGDNIFSAATDTLLGSALTDGLGAYRFASTNAGGTLAPGTLSVDDYFVRQLPVAGMSPPAAALVSITPAHVNGVTVQTIDRFDTTEQVVSANPIILSAGSSFAAPEAIGGERDVLVTYISGTDEVSAKINRFGSNLFAFESGVSVVGTALIQYDGVDGSASVLNATGLGGVSLSGGDASAGLLLTTRGDQVGASAVVRIYTSAANFSTTTIAIPNQATSEEIFVPFSSFIVGGGIGATFSSVGAVEVLIDGVSDLDATVTVLESRKPNEITVNLENQVPLIEIVKLTNGFDANTTTGPILAVGSTATFTYNVSNAGGSPLHNVQVSDDNGTPGNTSDDFAPTYVSGDTDSDSILDLTETWVFTASRVVTAGQYTNIGSVNAQDPSDGQVSDTDPSNHFGASPGIQVVKYTNGQDANTTTGPLLLVDSIATFTYAVTNTGNVPLGTVVLSDDNGTSGTTSDDFTLTLLSGDTNSNGRLDLTETWNYQATRTVTAGQYTNVATVTANPVDANGTDIAGLSDVSDTDPSNHFGVITGIQVVKYTNGLDANTTTGPLLLVGSTATFTYVVTNTGGVPLASVVLRDNNGTSGTTGDDFTLTLLSGDTNSNGRLDLTETWNYQATRTVTAGQYTNIATVTANPVDANGADIATLGDVTDYDPSNHFGVTTGIQVVKYTNGQDANSTTGPQLLVGSTATFTYVVTNTGSVPLATVVLRDDNGTSGTTGDDFTLTLLSGDTNSNGRLDLTETWNYQATRTVTAGQYTNIATVTANPVDANGTDIAGFSDVSDTDPSNHFGVTTGIQVVKYTNGLDANTTTGPQLLVGSTATFTYVVTNTGSVSLASVVLRDDNGTSGTTGDDFTLTLLSGDTNSNGRLDLTETWNYQATRTVTAGQYTNVATVTANPVDANGTDIAGLSDVNDTDPSNHFGVTTGIQVVKYTNGLDANTTTGPLLLVGSTATFTYIVTNTGSVPLASVVLRDDNGTSGTTGDDFTLTLVSGDANSNGRLDLTETWNYQATRTVTAGQYTNVATVTANPVDTNGTDIAGLSDVSDTDPSNHYGVTTGIQVVKYTNGQDANTTTGPQLLVGSTATFTYVVTNTGSVPLASVVLRDDNGTSGTTGDDFTLTLVSGDTNSNGRLDLTETWNYQATRTVTAGQYTNIATVTANPVDANGTDIAGLSDVSDTDPSNHFGYLAAIGLQKLTNGIDTGTGPGPTLSIGSTATFTYRVSNTGNVALTNLAIKDDNGTPSVTSDDFAPVYVSGDTDGDSQLDVTEIWVYRATRVVTLGAYSNIATVTGEDPNSSVITATDPSAHEGVSRLSKRRFISSLN